MRRFTESFDMQSFDQFNSALFCTIANSSLGGGDFAMSSGGAQQKQFSVSDDEWYFGYFFAPDNPGVNVNHMSVAWMNGSTVLGSLRFNGDKQLEVYVGSSPVSAGTYIWSNFEGRHIQVYVKIANSGGKIQVKVDGVLEVDFTGDTQPGADTVVDGFKHEADGVYAAIVVNDSTGTEDNSWPGVVRMRGRKPDEDGSYDGEFDLDPASPATAYTKLDEATAPDTSDIISTDVNGAKQSLRFPSHGLIRAQVLAVNYLYYMRKVSAGEAIHGVLRISDSNEQSDASPRALSTSFRTESFRYTTNPITGLPWTLDEAQEDEHESVIEAVV
jgi:hypothetical protein